MTEDEFSHNPQEDALWQAFDSAEQEKAAAEEAAYQEAEGRNRLILNQVVGLEDVVYGRKPDAENHGDGFQPPAEFRQRSTNNSVLFMRPDRRHELMAQGENPDTIEWLGSPTNITGEVPPRTQKLLDDLLTGLEAVPDETESTPVTTAWKGNIAGRPIIIDVHTRQKSLEVAGEVTYVPELFAIARRPKEREPKIYDEPMMDEVQEIPMLPPEKEIPDLSIREFKSAALDKTEELPETPQPKPRRRKIFPRRRKF